MHILPPHQPHAAHRCQTPLLLVIHTSNHLNGRWVLNTHPCLAIQLNSAFKTWFSAFQAQHSGLGRNALGFNSLVSTACSYLDASSIKGIEKQQ